MRFSTEVHTCLEHVRRVGHFYLAFQFINMRSVVVTISTKTRHIVLLSCNLRLPAWLGNWRGMLADWSLRLRVLSRLLIILPTMLPPTIIAEKKVPSLIADLMTGPSSIPHPAPIPRAVNSPPSHPSYKSINPTHPIFPRAAHFKGVYPSRNVIDSINAFYGHKPPDAGSRAGPWRLGGFG